MPRFRRTIVALATAGLVMTGGTAVANANPLISGSLGAIPTGSTSPQIPFNFLDFLNKLPSGSDLPGGSTTPPDPNGSDDDEPGTTPEPPALSDVQTWFLESYFDEALRIPGVGRDSGLDKLAEGYLAWQSSRGWSNIGDDDRFWTSRNVECTILKVPNDRLQEVFEEITGIDPVDTPDPIHVGGAVQIVDEGALVAACVDWR